MVKGIIREIVKKTKIGKTKVIYGKGNLSYSAMVNDFTISLYSATVKSLTK